MYSKISEDTYRKLIDKLVKIPYVTGAHATHAIFGDGIEVAFQCPYMGKMFEYYLVADCSGTCICTLCPPFTCAI